MSNLIIFLVALVIVGLVPILTKRLLRKENQINTLLKRVTNFLALVFSLLILTSIILSFCDYYFVGYKTTTFLLIATTLLFIVNYLITQFKNKLYQFIVESLLFFAIVVSGFISTFNLVNYQNNCFYSDSNYRLETFEFIGSPKGKLPSLYIKNRVLEKRVKLSYPENYNYDQVHDIRKKEIENYVIEQHDGKILVTFKFNDGYEITTEAWLSNSCD